MKSRIIPFLLLFMICSPLIPCQSAEEGDIDNLVVGIQNSLNMNNIPAYLENFSPEIRKKEEERIRDLYDQFPIRDVALYRAKRDITNKAEKRIYLQALFRSPHSVVIETWGLALSKEENRWQINEKRTIGDVKELYKIKIPFDRVERVKSIEIENVDIKLTFRNAVVFYDNIPKIETALLIIGDGNLHFSPSDSKEKHQLEILYKRRYLEDRLKYAYLRFSNHFFKENIKIVEEEEDRRFLISESEKSKARSLFEKHYPRSFTIENSLDKDLLSFLPQGLETVFEFEGRKRGRFTYIHSPTAEEEVNLYQWKGKKIISHYSPVVDEDAKKIFLSFGPLFDIRNYQIDIAFDPEKTYLSGKARVEFTPEVRLIDGIKFRFNPDLEILRIYDEEKRRLFYTQDKLRQYVYVYFFKPIPQGKTSAVEIYYRGKLIPPKQVADVIPSPQYDESLLYSPLNYDSYLYSQSTYWYPSPPEDDYFQVRLKVIVPPEYTCIANGELIEQSRINGVDKVEEIEKIGNAVFVYESKYPIKYISLIVGKFHIVEEDPGPIPLKLFKSTNYVIQRKQLVREAREIIGFYESKFGPYPYGKLTIIQRAWSTSGGHSPASFVILNEMPQIREKGSLVKLKGPVDLSRWREYFIAHEIAHQWWGQAVTSRTYHDQWLSEGLAQFSSILFLVEKHGEKILSPIMKKLSYWTEKKSKMGAITMGSRLSYFDFDAFQSVIYNKASLVLFMLKDFLGDEVFFEGLRMFFSENKYGVASTRDFISVFNQVSGKDLMPFFKGWFDSHVLPQVKVSHSITKKEEGYLLKLTVIQEKGLFIFPLWVEMSSDGNRIRKKLLIDEKTEKFDFEFKEKPRGIKVNNRKAVPGKFN